MIVSHHGDYGDVVYSLPAVKYLADEAGAAAQYYLCPAADTRVRMTAEHAEGILPLLREQPYIASARWRERPLGFRIDVAQRRFYQPGMNITDQLTHWAGIPYSDQLGAWLTVAEPNRHSAVVFARSQRYRNPHFPWREVYRRFGRAAVFVGTLSEHQDFIHQVGQVPLVPTPTLLDVAKLLAGAQLFVGNQSCPLSIAHGLRMPVVVEQCPDCKNCHFGRPNAWYDEPPPEELSV